MNIYLTSQASEVLEDLIKYLPKPPRLMCLAFVPNASDIYDEKPWQDSDKNRLLELGFDVEEVDIVQLQGQALEDKLREKDGIFVAGGSASYLLKKAQESDFLGITRRLLLDGKIYIGSSAGSLLAAKNIELDHIFYDDTFNKKLDSYEGLGIVDFIPIPHAGNKEYHPYHKKIFDLYKDKYNLKKINDKEAIIIIDGNVKLISKAD